MKRAIRLVIPVARLGDSYVTQYGSLFRAMAGISPEETMLGQFRRFFFGHNHIGLKIREAQRRRRRIL